MKNSLILPLLAALAFAIDQKDASLKTTTISEGTEGPHVPSQKSGSEMVGIGEFVGDVKFDKLFTKGLCPDIKGMDNIQFK